jgi:multiple sugar transport system substrate-binding protein
MRTRVIGMAAVVALVASACGFGSSSAPKATVVDTASTTQHTPVTLTFWSAYTEPELSKYQQAFQGFHAKYPWITVKGTGNIEDDKILAAINSGTPPDAVLSFSPNNTGKFCSSGAWLSLNDYIAKDHVDLGVFPKVALDYSGYKGNQCALPALADAYGLYYNKAMFAKAGIAAPPTTLSELFADAKKLTVRNADGTIKVAGFVPWNTYYEMLADPLRLAYDAPWFDASGKPLMGTDPRWAAFLRYQKQFVDWYGVKNLQRFVAGKGDEFSAQNDFEKGRVAMLYDGEWRDAFIKDEAPALQYGAAPFPAADDAPQQFGAGTIAGDIVGIPRGSKHPAEAWLLIKYLTTDTAALVGLSNRLKNLPTTTASVNSPDIEPDPNFAPFLKIFANPRSSFNPLTPIGQQYGDTFSAFFSKWQAGKVPDLQKGLQGVAKQIQTELDQAGS